MSNMYLSGIAIPRRSRNEMPSNKPMTRKAFNDVLRIINSNGLFSENLFHYYSKYRRKHVLTINERLGTHLQKEGNRL